MTDIDRDLAAPDLDLRNLKACRLDGFDRATDFRRLELPEPCAHGCTPLPVNLKGIGSLPWQSFFRRTDWNFRVGTQERCANLARTCSKSQETNQKIVGRLSPTTTQRSRLPGRVTFPLLGDQTSLVASRQCDLVGIATKCITHDGPRSSPLRPGSSRATTTATASPRRGRHHVITTSSAPSITTRSITTTGPSGSRTSAPGRQGYRGKGQPSPAHRRPRAAACRATGRGPGQNEPCQL
jgi:hypothetical protein